MTCEPIYIAILEHEVGFFDLLLCHCLAYSRQAVNICSMNKLYGLPWDKKQNATFLSTLVSLTHILTFTIPHSALLPSPPSLLFSSNLISPSDCTLFKGRYLVLYLGSLEGDSDMRSPDAENTCRGIGKWFKGEKAANKGGGVKSATDVATGA